VAVGVGDLVVCLGGGLKKRDLEIGVQVVGLGRNLRSLAGWCATVACRGRTELLSNSQLCAVPRSLVSLLGVFREQQGKPIKIRDEVSE
jgi:hypothetical protein